MSTEEEVDIVELADHSYKPSLHTVHKILESKVVGEHKTRMAIFTTWILGEKPVFVGGPRSSGKSFTTYAIADIIGDIKREGMCYNLSSGSEKSAWYQQEQINKAKYLLVTELNRIPSELKETLKYFGEGKSATYDVTVVDEITGRRKTERKELLPRPFCFCLADEDEAKVDEQLYSRLVHVRMDSSEHQNIQVISQQAKEAMGHKRNNKGLDEEIGKLRFHLATMPSFQKYQFINPAAELFVRAIPTMFTDSRRDFPKLLANMAGIERFYWKEGLQGTIGKKSHLFFITPRSMWLSHHLFADALVESSLRCSAIERLILESLGKEWEFPETVQKRVRSRGIMIGVRMVKKHLQAMSDLGYVEKQEAQGTKLTFKAGDMYQDFTYNLDWKSVIKTCAENMIKQYPKYAEEYMKRYCKEPVFEHPITGESVDLRTLGRDHKGVETHNFKEAEMAEEVVISD